MLEQQKKAWPELVQGVPKGLEHGLRNFWYPIMQSEDVTREAPVAIKCLNEDLVVFRDAQGRPGALLDRCPHRSVKLSAGRILNGQLQCALHGLRFDRAGRCVLIPWEQEDSALLEKVAAVSFPAEEVGGYIWAYIGDASRFPPPPLAESVPEELLYPDRYIHFRLPTDIWEANWLLVVDGSDGYHAVTLHAESQQHDAVRQYIGAAAAREFSGDSQQGSMPIPLSERRVKIVETEGHGIRGIAVDREGRHLDHGHRLESYKGERFNLPSLFTNVLQPVGNARPYVSRLFKVPVDYGRTRLFRYAAWREDRPEERERLKAMFETIVRPRQLKTASEDKAMAAACGDLVRSRSNEFLLPPDRDVAKIRRRITNVFLAQQLEGKRLPAQESTPNTTSLVFPI